LPSLLIDEINTECHCAAHLLIGIILCRNIMFSMHIKFYFQSPSMFDYSLIPA
jgi:hypothetical protein